MTSLLTAATGAAGESRRQGRRRSAWSAARSARATGPAAGTQGSPVGTHGKGSAVGTHGTTSTDSAGLAASGTAGHLRLADVIEDPLVVMVAAGVESDRLVLALAAHAHHAAGKDA